MPVFFYRLKPTTKEPALSGQAPIKAEENKKAKKLLTEMEDAAAKVKEEMDALGLVAFVHRDVSPKHIPQIKASNCQCWLLQTVTAPTLASNAATKLYSIAAEVDPPGRTVVQFLSDLASWLANAEGDIPPKMQCLLAPF